MSTPNNAYTNPKLYGIDYTTINQEIDKGVEAIGASLKSLADQRKAAYEELKSNYAEYNDLTYIERAKGLDEQANMAIKDSVDASLIEFSNMSEYEKNRNIQQVKDVRIAKTALEEIIEKATDKNIKLYKGVNKGYLDFARDLAGMRNVEFKPSQNGVGFTVIHKNQDGSVREEYNMSDIQSMTTKFQDVSEVIAGVNDKMDDIAKTLSQRKEAIVGKYGDGAFNIDNYQEQFDRAYNLLTEEDKEVFFSEYVEVDGIRGYHELSPSIYYDEETGEVRELSAAEKRAAREANEIRLKEEIKKTVEGRIGEYYREPVQTESNNRKGLSGGEIQIAAGRAREFKKDVERWRISGNSKHMNKWTIPNGIKLEEFTDKDGTKMVRAIKFKDTDEDVTFDINGRPIVKTGEEKLKDQVLGEFELGDNQSIYNLVIREITEGKGNTYRTNRWVDFIYDPLSTIEDSFYKQNEKLRPKKQEAGTISIGETVPKETEIDSNPLDLDL